MYHTPKVEPVSADDAVAIARDAYVYLYPLVLMDITRRQLLAADPAAIPVAGPANAFRHIRAFPDAEMRAVVRPNFDTLYSIAWLDLRGGPVVVSTADSGGRYFMLPMLDMWTNAFAVPGKRTSGTGAADFAVVPAGWTGTLPEGMHRIDAPTDFVWIIGRTQADGPADFEAVARFQDGLGIAPLSNAPPAEPAPEAEVDTATEPLRQVAAMPAEAFFRLGAELMGRFPPQLTDWSILARMARIGIVPGACDLDRAHPATLEEGKREGLELMEKTRYHIGQRVNGWILNTETMGVYGNHYLKRAVVAQVGLGANQPLDAVYPDNFADADGNPVMAEHRYVLHFEASRIPPVDAFWSVTMYDAEGFQVANPIDRYAIGDRDDLNYNADGSLDIWIQHEDPGPDKASNWLPAPAAGVLGITMRLYAPRQEVIDGRWLPPPIRRLD